MPNAEDAIILCGGAGLRLQAVTGGAPKSMASVSGRPLLEILLRQLRRHGFRRAILATGYRGTAIRSHFGEASEGMELAYSEELSPLGTGGALRNAAHQVGSAACMVLNGDSYTDVDLERFVAAHWRSNADVSIVVVPGDERSDAGSIQLDSLGNVLQFVEKEGLSSGRYLNAGIYALSRQILLEIPAAVPISLERELFPRWIRQGLCVRAFVHTGKCVDIGTPDRYAFAQTVLADAEVATSQANEGAKR